MSTDAVTTSFAVMAVLGVLAVVALLVGAAIPATRPTVRGALAGQGLALGWLVATVATLGSLYLSEVAHFVPCRLCWYQRIAMYPLVVVLGIGALRRDAGARLPAMVLAGIGMAVNLWHLAVELWPSIEGSGCDPNNPCSLRWIEVWGLWTIPRLATVAFSLILVVLALDPAPGGIDTEDDPTAPSTPLPEESLQP